MSANIFDPKKKYASEGLPPGDYLIALVDYQRKESKEKRKPYLRAKYEVVAGAAAGKTFYATISLDTDNGGAMTRLSLMAECCGVTEAFDLNSDKAFTDAFCDRPFKARVKRTTENGYTNNDIERYLKDVSSHEQKAMDAWVLNSGEEREMDSKLGASGGSGARGKSSASDFADDDIPF